MLAQTPFHARTAPLVRAQTWRRWAGHQVASAYDPHPDREYAAVRNSAALFDVSPLKKYLIKGRDAARLLDAIDPDALATRVPKDAPEPEQRKALEAVKDEAATMAAARTKSF